MVGQLTVSLVPSSHHGFNISCFGEKDGAIDLVVTGGTPPYLYDWSTSATTQDVSNLPAGYYAVMVKDNTGTEMRADITLTEPDMLRGDPVAYRYPNGYNISLFDGYNGSIDLSISGGVTPYSVVWHDGPTTEDRSALGSGNYGAIITDVNGCYMKTEEVYLRQPERSDWTNSGNAGTDPATNYIGTSDNKDVVFKSNGVEGLRLLGNGDIKVSGSITGAGVLYRTEDGILRLAGGGGDLFPESPCGGPGAPVFQFWETGGNDFGQLCPDSIPRFGTLTNHPFHVITNSQVRMVVSKSGKVGIGTTPPPGPIDQYRLFVEDGIATRDVLVKVGMWPDYVFDTGYHLMPLDELRDFLNTNRHLPGVPSAKEVAEKNGVEVGDLQTKMLKVVEEQALYILEQAEKLKALEQRIRVLEASRK
jgi:SprB repeat